MVPPRTRASERASSAKMAAWAAWIGSAFAYYDFFLYNTAAVLFLGPVFFPGAVPWGATLAAVVSIGAGYISRPIGALVLGHLGDVYGRRMVLCLTLLLMGGAAFAIGVLPSYESIGMAAPVLLVSLRLLQGFAVSGEQAGAQTLLLEMAPEKRRGLYASFALSGSLIGFVLASVVFLLLSWFLPEQELRTWGWRIPFLLSLILVFLGLWIRLKLPESAAFLSEKREKGTKPLKILCGQYKLAVLRVVCATQVSIVSTIVPVFSLWWAVEELHMSKTLMLGMLITSAIAGAVFGPLWAHLSDKTGRRPVFIFGALASGGLIWPYLWAISQSNSGLVFAFGMLLGGCAYPAANAVWASLYGEMFKTQVRFSGVAIGTQLGLMLSAQAPAMAIYLTQSRSAAWISVAWIVSGACALAASVVFLLRETSQTNMVDLGRNNP